MNLSNQPRIVYSGTTLDFTRPCRPTIPESDTVGTGGMAESALGIPAAYVVIRNSLLDVPLRFSEEEWSDVLDFLYFAQAAQAVFTFYPDQDNLDESYSCYIRHPAMGETIRPTRSEYFGDFELTITIRSVSGEFAARYFLPLE